MSPDASYNGYKIEPSVNGLQIEASSDSPKIEPSANGSQIERRAVVELRADRQRIVGHALVFDTRSRDLGGFVEVVRRDAVLLKSNSDVVALYNHDPGAVLGRTPQTLQLTTDTRGLAFVLDPAPTQAGRDAFELVKRGDITGASFGFRTKRDAWREEAGTVIRELLDIEIAEISLTAFPAYQDTDVSVAMRSLQNGLPHIHSKPCSVHWLQLKMRVG